MIRLRVSLVLLILTAPASWGSAAVAKEPAAPEPICEAFRLTEPDLYLVVAGECRRCPDDPEWCEVAVEKALYGSWTGGKVRELYVRAKHKTHGVFALVFIPHLSYGPYVHYQKVEPGEQKGLMILGEMQRDYQALRATSIVVGKVVETANSRRIIEVVRTLKGPALKPATRLTLDLRTPDNYEEELPDTSPAEAIYLLGAGEAGEKNEPLIYPVLLSQPLNQEPAVLAALKRGTAYPIIEKQQAGKTVRQRQILFRGSIEETQRLLCSGFREVAQLGRSRLEHEHRNNPTLLPRMIEQELSRAEGTAPDSFCLLHRLIPMVASPADKAEQQQPIRSLLDRHLDRLASGRWPLRPPPRERVQGRERIGEEKQLDVNHGLVWLLRNLTPDLVRREYAARLRQLRQQGTEAVRREAQLALDVLGIEEQEEIEHALRLVARLSESRQVAKARLGESSYGRPQRSERCSFFPDATALAFSPDGRFLAVASSKRVCVLHTRDWSVAGDFASPGVVSRLCFSPDGRSLFLVGHGHEPGRYDWSTGRLLRSYPWGRQFQRLVNVTGLEVSANGERLAISSRDTLAIGETETGKRLALFETAGIQSLSLDGNSLISRVRINTTPAGAPGEVESVASCRLTTLEEKPVVLRELPADRFWMVVPGGRHLLSLERPSADAPQQPAILRIHERNGDCRELARSQSPYLGSWMAVSANGKHLVVLDREFTDRCRPTRGTSLHFSLFSLPDLRLVRSWVWGSNRPLDLLALQLAPDGQTLALKLREGGTALYLFDTRTGEPIVAHQGHGSQIEAVDFLPDGQTLRTRDRDGIVCIWDAQLRLRSRLVLPSTFGALPTQPPDGKCLLGRFHNPEGAPAQLGLVDADTGGRMCLFPDRGLTADRVLWFGDTQAFLLEDHRLVRIDYRQGKILQSLPIEMDLGPTKVMGELRWSDRSPVVPFYGWTSHQMEVNTLNLETGKLSRADLIPQLKPFNIVASAAGGDRLCLGSEGALRCLASETHRVLVERRFTHTRLEELRWSAASPWFAVELQRLDSAPRDWPTRMIGIGDIHTGRLLGSIPAARASQFFLSPEGRRLVLVHEDNTLELWDLAELHKQ